MTTPRPKGSVGGSSYQNLGKESWVEAYSTGAVNFSQGTQPVHWDLAGREPREQIPQPLCLCFLQFHVSSPHPVSPTHLEARGQGEHSAVGQAPRAEMGGAGTSKSKCKVFWSIGGVDKEGMIDTSSSGVDQDSFLEVQASLVLHTAAKDLELPLHARHCSKCVLTHRILK